MKIISKELAKLEIENCRLASENAQLKADLAYVMMCTGTEIPEEEKDELHED